MAQVKRQEENKKDAGVLRRFNRGSWVENKADWKGLDGIQLIEAVQAITAAGGAIRLGLTSDGGAYAIGIYGDGPTPYTEYLRPSDDLNEFFDSLAKTFSEETPIVTERTAGRGGSKA